MEESERAAAFFLVIFCVWMRQHFTPVIKRQQKKRGRVSCITRGDRWNCCSAFWQSQPFCLLGQFSYGLCFMFIYIYLSRERTTFDSVSLNRKSVKLENGQSSRNRKKVSKYTTLSYAEKRIAAFKILSADSHQYNKAAN